VGSSSDNVNVSCYLCWHGVFSCAWVSFPVSALCAHCPHNERNVVSRCLPAPTSSHILYVIIGFLYIRATRVLLYSPLQTKLEITRVRFQVPNKMCTQKRPTELESGFVCLIQQSGPWQAETNFLAIHKPPDFYQTRKFIAMFTKARHCVLTCSTSIQPSLSHTRSLTANATLNTVSTFTAYVTQVGSSDSGLPACLCITSERMQATCTAHSVLFNFIILTISGEEYTFWSSQLLNFPSSYHFLPL
jgi:hypothetical protein